jgi:hypothetical protein
VFSFNGSSGERSTVQLAEFGIGKDASKVAVYCFHEVSSLFENLSTFPKPRAGSAGSKPKEYVRGKKQCMLRPRPRQKSLVLICSKVKGVRNSRVPSVVKVKANLLPRFAKAV